MPCTVISFYTNDWLYPRYAQELRAACDRFGLDHHIVEKPSTHSYVGNCQIKPFFIQECLQQFQRPVLWIDADAALLARPDRYLSHDVLAYDIVGNHPVASPHRVHVGSFMFNHTPGALEFVDTWCAEIHRKRPLDDAAFNGTWDSLQKKMRFLALPPEYFFIQKNPAEPAPAGTVILHRLSNSTLKQEYKQSTSRK